MQIKLPIFLPDATRAVVKGVDSNDLISCGEKDRPLLIAVIQGGFDKELRKECAEQLFEIGFDGYGAGGYLMQEGVFSEDIMQFMSNLIPNGKLKFALGVGAPTDVVKSFKCGWQIFDCTLPTRDARHKRFYSFINETKSIRDL